MIVSIGPLQSIYLVLTGDVQSEGVAQQKTAVRGMRTPTQSKTLVRSTVGNSRTRLVGTISPLRQSPFATSDAWEGLHQGKGRKRKREDESREESRPRTVRNVQELTNMFSTKGPRKRSKSDVYRDCTTWLTGALHSCSFDRDEKDDARLSQRRHATITLDPQPETGIPRRAARLRHRREPVSIGETPLDGRHRHISRQVYIRHAGKSKTRDKTSKASKSRKLASGSITYEGRLRW
jgi:hypothetical protein